MRKPLRLLAVLLVFAPALVLLPAAAHVELAESNPKDGAKLDKMPGALSFTFSEALEGTANITLERGKDFVPISAERREGKTVHANITGDPGGGAYTASYLVTGKDGHPIRGSIRFTVAGKEKAIKQPEAVAPGDGGFSWPFVVLIFAGAAAAGVAASAWASRRFG